MPFRKRLILSALALSMTLVVSACKSAEERAEEHYQTALELMSEGDYDRAVIELRNVFELDGSHREARRALAQLMLDQRGNRQEAYSQYLRLVEQYPDDLEARVELAQIAFSTGNWEELERHGAKAAELAPDDFRVKALSVARNYRNAVLAENTTARRDATRTAQDLLKEQDDNIILRSVIIDNLLRENEFQSALTEIDRMLEQDPGNLMYNQQRLNVLVRLGDMAGAEAHLRTMIERFPDEVNQKAMLLRFYMAQKDLDKAEAFLRELASAATDEDTGPLVDLIRFLAQYRSVAAAKAEIESATAKYSDPTPFRVLDAGIDFSAGNREAAVKTLEAVLATAEPSEQTRNIKISLARMLLSMGNEVGARSLVEAVLAEAATHPEALKMQAGWLIQADQTDAAIAALRTALDQKSEDAQALTLMAEAYTRSGRPELARDFLALAVEASGRAPAETNRYAKVLISEKSYLPAEDILLAALRLDSNNPDLLLTLGELYLAMEDFARAQHVADTLRRLETPEASAAANGIEAERINRQSGRDEAMAYLEALAKDTNATLASRISLIRAKLGSGDKQAALTLAQELVTDTPDSDQARFVLAATQAVNGNLAEAETIYRALVDAEPARAPIWLELSRIKQRQGERDAAKAVIDEGLAHNPSDASLLWALASFHEQDGKIDDAIGIYERLYETDSSSLVVANNLASLLATYRDDAESLERAWIVARRFRDTRVPAVQDTYGWILHRRGESAEALPYLEAAAKGLTNDPLVQYHVAEAYLTLERRDEALAHFQRTLEIAGPSDKRPQIEEARRKVQTLMQEAAPVEKKN